MANVVVTHRPGWSREQLAKHSELARLVEEKTLDADKLSGKQAGNITFIAVTQLDISSTQIRRQLQTGNSVSFLLPEKVEQLILNQNIYR
jgi:nicotinate-nucleotide adenylyltransferase